MQNILVPIDFSEITPRVIDQTRSLSQNRPTKVWLIHVAAPEPDFVGYEPGPQVVRDQVAHRLQKEHKALHDYAESLRQAGIEATPLLVQGQTVEKILEESVRTQADLIVLGSHGHGALRRALLGGTSEGVLRKARCAVVIVPATA